MLCEEIIPGLMAQRGQLSNPDFASRAWKSVLAIAKVGLTLLSHIIHEDPPSETCVRRTESNTAGKEALFLDAPFHCFPFPVQIEVRLRNRWSESSARTQRLKAKCHRRRDNLSASGRRNEKQTSLLENLQVEKKQRQPRDIEGSKGSTPELIIDHSTVYINTCVDCKTS